MIALELNRKEKLMARMRMKLMDGQDLGYVQLRDGTPYYGYRRHEATEMDFEFAKYLAKKFKQGTYEVTIECSKGEYPVVWKPYTVVVK